MKKKIIVVAIAATLTACGNPTSSGAGTEQGSMSSVDSAIQWTKKLVRGWTAKATMQIPAAGAIADALLDPKFVGTRMQGGDFRGLAPMLEKQGFDYLKKLGPADQAAAEKDVGNLLAPVAAITSAYRGWQINMIGGFGEAEASPLERKMYLGYQEAAVEYTNALFTQIATTLNNDVGVLEDPATAKAEIQKIFNTIPKSTLVKLWNDAVDHANERGGRVADLSGTQGVDWSADGGSYSGMPDGLTWTKSGVVWFGKGALSGKQWTIGLESSISKSIDKSSGGSQSTGASTGEKSSTSAQPK